MSDSQANTKWLLHLADEVCEERASEDDLLQLDAMLFADNASRHRYLDYCRMHTALALQLRAQCASEKLYRHIDDLGAVMIVSEPTSCGTIPLPSVAPEQTPLQRPAHTFPATLWHGTLGYFSSGWPVAYLVATVIFGVGALIGSVIYVSHPAQVANKPSIPVIPLTESNAESVGRITGMVDCKWVGTAVDSAHVALGQKYELASGLMKITYDTGAKVILQGPVTYEVESASSGYLSIGKLTGKVEVETAKGFLVRTPTATVTDLGTEFGVEVDHQGNTTSHVYQGSVQVQAVGSGGKPEGAARVLRENESVRVTGDAIHKIVPVHLLDPDFVREIPKQAIKALDLVDVVAGGDGFSSRRGRGIDPTNGQIVDSPREARILLGDDRYHRVEELPFVDGVFIPDGSRGPVQIDSSGHRFDAFGAVQSATWHPIWAGGRIPVRDSRKEITAILGGVDYGDSGSGRGVLYMNANKGITFDLDAIRRANPGEKIVRFCAVVGNIEMAAVAGTNDVVHAKTLLAQNFNGAPIGAIAPSVKIKSAAPDDYGHLELAVDGAHARVVGAVDPHSNTTDLNRYVDVHRAWVWATGWNAADTEGRIVRLSASVRLSSESGTMGLLDGLTARNGDRSFTVYLTSDGGVNFSNGKHFVPTNLICRPDAWQNLVVTANMAARTFSIKLDDQPLYADGYWSSNATRVGGVMLGKNTASGTIRYDNLRLSVLESSTLDQCKPQWVAADAWIIVDGVRRSGRRGFNREGGAYTITVPLADGDRFLTLAATDAGNDLFWDSVVWGNPRLEMAPQGIQRGPSSKRHQPSDRENAP